jgi:hypothetical protein
VPLSLLHEDWPPEVKLTAYQLNLALEEQRFRDGLEGEDAAEIRLSPPMILLITGCKRADSAARVLRKLAASVSLVVHSEGSTTVLRWPKYAEWHTSDAPKGTPRREERRREEKRKRKKEKATESSRQKGTNPRAQGSNPRAEGANPRAKPKVPCPSPDEWSDEACARVLKATDCNTDALRAGIEAVHNWSEEKDMRRTLRGWEATARRAVKERWGKNAGNGAARGRRDPESNYTPPPVSKNFAALADHVLGGQK